MKVVLCVLALVCSCVLASSPSITLDVDDNSASYTISVNGVAWFNSGATSVRSGGVTYTTANDTLTFLSSKNYTGSDALGPYTARVWNWGLSSSSSSGTPFFVTTFKSYTDTNALVLEQSFPQGADGCSTGDANAVLSSFPSYYVNATDSPRGFYGFDGNMGWYDVMGEWAFSESYIPNIPFGLNGTCPLIVFDEDYNTVIVSPFSTFMATNQAFNNATGELSYGVMGRVQSVPAHYSTSVVFYYGDSISGAMSGWGDALRTTYGKTRAGPAEDLSVTHLGYYTDNGAYYYYLTEPNKTYEQTIIDIYTDSVANDIPYRYVQLDSWWYYKGIENGVTNWTAMPSIFPNGSSYVHSHTHWPIVAHNRYWASDNVYATQNGGEWDFIVEEYKAIPTEQAFWDYLMSTSTDWGLYVYEQDWLFNEFSEMNCTLENATLARTWLLQMGQAATNAGLHIQYCMPYPRHILQSVEVPAVTQIRASNDAIPSRVTQWEIGPTAMLAHALALAPSKDNFWTTTDQPGNPYNGSEPYVELECLSAVLSTGPVGPADRIGYANRTLIMMTCRADGLILKPSAPAVPIDAWFGGRVGFPGPTGRFWTTHSNVSGLVWNHILSANLTATYSFSYDQLTQGGEGSDGMVYWYHGSVESVSAFGSGESIKIHPNTPLDFDYIHTAPVYGGLALLGEAAKWVPVSEGRFADIAIVDGDITGTLLGTYNEVVEVFVASTTSNTRSSSGYTVSSFTCTLPADGQAAFSLVNNACYAYPSSF